ncbi:PPE domain-containing protein [Mycolicibacterium brisbanense]|uniref:Antigen MTB48 n=1 Tax=Mycolicibacterium brisbanense TaxID=146020 RepID=A0A124E006_9MYCO|nr:hypothetical protein [Mycolicibacterium brisbanense]MCV7160543.1 hypothetical protein [Mycolicibacterium brisbanense]GAS88998.1 antigen MTB48 [Mycolicibacterium brisbanense]
MGDGDPTPLKISAETLRTKASQLTDDFPQAPQDPGDLSGSPCELEIAQEAVSVIRASVTNLRNAAEAGESEGRRLAACLSAAADAYQLVEDAAAKSIAGGVPQGVESIQPHPNVPPAEPMPTPATPQPTSSKGVDNDLEPAAEHIYGGDGVGKLSALRDAVQNFRDLVVKHADKFNLGDTIWDGQAAQTAESALVIHRTWLTDTLAPACDRVTSQIDKLMSTHGTWQHSHPTPEMVAKIFELPEGSWQGPYEALQGISTNVLDNYAAGVDTQPVTVSAPPPGAYKSPAVKPEEVAPRDKSRELGKKEGEQGGPGDKAGSGGGDETPQDGKSPASGAAPNSAATKPQSASASSGGAPSGGGSPAGGGSPSSGGAPAGGMPGGLGGAKPSLPNLKEPSLKPAGLGSGGGGAGGGGAGGGGGGIPSSPLSPAPVAVDAQPTRGPVPVNTAPAGPPGAGGGMGGGGMGGGGMGHGGGQQGKEKRRDPNLSPDEDLYIEDRAHTEPVIGRQAPPRRRKEDGKESS